MRNKNKILIAKKSRSNAWEIIDQNSKKAIVSNLNKTIAISESKRLAHSGNVVILCDKNDIKQVFQPFSTNPIRQAKVKRRRSNSDVNIAIVKALKLCK